MDNPEVHAPHLVAVVVEQCGDSLAVSSRNLQLLVEFAFDGAEVSRFVKMRGVRVAVVDVTANADGHLGVEACFTAGLAAGVAKNTMAVVKDEIRNELLVGRVVLGRSARQEKIVGRVEEGRHVALRVEREPFERAEAVKNCARDDENVFFGGHGGGR